jgi:hypothetical protein
MKGAQLSAVPSTARHALVQAAGISANAPRKEWPPEVLRSVVQELMREAPNDMLARELLAGAAGPTDWWRRQQAYARSAAVMSMVNGLCCVCLPLHADPHVYDL